MAERFKRATRSEVAFALDGSVRAARCLESIGLRLPTLGRRWCRETLDGRLRVCRPAQPLAIQRERRGGRWPTPPPRVRSCCSRAPTARIPADRLRGPGPGRHRPAHGADGERGQLRRGSHHHAPAVGPHDHDARDGGHRGRSRGGRREPDGRWHDEDVRLLAGTFDTMTEAIGRFQQQAAERDRLAALGRLSTVIAHEMRNPLMIVRAPCAACAERTTPRPTSASSDIDEQVQRLDRVVTDVLDFASPVHAAARPPTWSALCQDAVSAAPSAAGPPVDRGDARRPLVTATDADRLRTVLVNLIANAREAVRAERGARLDDAGVTVRHSPCDAATSGSRGQGTGIEPGMATGVRAILHHPPQGHGSRPCHRAQHRRRARRDHRRQQPTRERHHGAHHPPAGGAHS